MLDIIKKLCYTLYIKDGSLNRTDLERHKMIEINKDTVVLSLETYMELLDTIEFLKVEVQQGNTVYRYNKGFNDGFDVGVNDGLIEAIELLKTFAKEEK